MADKELRRLKRRELLEMLLVQCEETERLQKESDDIRERFDEMAESYERLKKKLDIKDERLSQKDAKITELRREITELKRSREAEIAEVGTLTEATLKLNKAFEEARQAAEQYLVKMGMIREENKVVPVSFGQKAREINLDWKPATEEKREIETFVAASGDSYGR